MNDPAAPPPPPPEWVPPPLSAGHGLRGRLRWGLGDFAWVFPFGLFCGAVAGLVGIAIANGVNGVALESDALSTDPIVTGFSAAGQFGGWFAGLWIVSRFRGLGTLLADFGLTIRANDWWALFLGVGAQVVLSLLLLPISSLDGAEKQSIVEDIKDAAIATKVVLVVTAVVLAPLVEELLFRGLFLRGLMRRMTAAPAVVISGAVFGITHVLDPNAFASLPALCAFGVLAGVLTVRSGRLSQAVLLHTGFNGLGVVLIVVS